MVGGAVALALALAAHALPLSAHVTVLPREAPHGASLELRFHVPNERATVDTTGFVVRFPPAAPIASVEPLPLAGWSARVRMRHLAVPLRTSAGAAVTAVVDTIAWTGGVIHPHTSLAFGVRAGPLPATGSELVFKALQVYADGETVRWIEHFVPRSAGSAESGARAAPRRAGRDAAAAIVRWPACVLVIVAAVLCAPSPVRAHAVLLDAVPASGERVDTSPGTIRLHFDEAVETALGSVRVLDARGIDRAQGAPSHPAGDANTVVVRVGGLERGRYVVAWNVVSADSHPVSGAYAFGVGEDAGEVPAGLAGAVAPGLGWLIAVARFLVLVSLLVATGMAAASRTIVINNRAGRAPMLELCAWLGLAVCAYVELSFQADVTGGSLFDVFATRFGMLRLVMVGAAFAGLIAVCGTTRRWTLLAPAIAVAIASEALSGHALTSAYPAVSVPVDALHLAAVAVWIGVLATTLIAPHSVDARRVSNVATCAVVVLVLTAVGQSLATIATPAALLTTAYGWLVCAKIALFGVALAFASRARRRVGLGSAALTRDVRRELVVLTAIVAVTAVLVDGNPPRASARTAAEPTAGFAVRDVHVLVRAQALGAGRWRVLVTTRAHDRARDVDEVRATLTEPAKRIGPLPATIAHVGAGVYEADVQPPFAGAWSVTIRARVGDFDENAAVLNLPK